MMWNHWTRPASLVVAASITSVAASQDLSADLEAIARELPERHVDFFHQLDKPDWEAAITELRSRLEGMSEEQVVFELAALCALAGDAHTGVDLRSAGVPMMTLPLGLGAFDDGMFVTQAGPLQALHLRSKLVAINGIEIEEVIERVGRLIAADNVGRLRQQASQLVFMRGALMASGIIDGPQDRVTLSLLTPGAEKPSNHDVMFADSGMLPMIQWRRAPDFTMTRPPMYLRRASGNYQSDFDDSTGTLYVAYNACREAGDLPMERFAQLVLGYWDRLDPQRLLIDLRHNGGGDERVLGPLIDAIDDHPEIDQPQVLYVATGPRTFSSAVSNALRISKLTEAVLVGEPTGGAPNHFGEVRDFSLPSGIRVFYSTKYFERVEDETDALAPELHAPMTSDHWFNGRDPVLEAIAQSQD